MVVALLAIGFVSIISQVVLLRELSVTFYGIELVYVLAIGAWMLWTAVGAALGRHRHVTSPGRIAALFLVFAVVLALDLGLLRTLRASIGGLPGTYLPLGRQLPAVVVVCLPVGIVLGLLFQWAARRYIGGGGTLATAYAIECAGALLGGLASTLVIIGGVSNLASGLICGIGAVVVAATLWRGIRRSVRCAVLLCGLLLCIAFVCSPQIDRGLTRLNHPGLVDTRDSPYGRITITRSGDQFAVFENDVLTFETQGVGVEELVHLPALHCRAPRRVLVLGGGVGGILAEILRHSPDVVDYVEMNPLLIDLCRRHLPTDYMKPLSSERVRVIVTDPREFITRASSYDLILLGAADPASGSSDRLYTRQFFALCARALTPDGVMGLRLASSGNIRTRPALERIAAVYRALKVVFSDVRVLPGMSDILIASVSTLTADAAIPARELARRAISTRLVTDPYIRYLYTNDRYTDLAARLASTTTPPNSDTAPSCYRYAAVIWLSKFFPSLINPPAGSGDVTWPRRALVVLLPVTVLLITFHLVRRQPTSSRAVLIATVASAGMVLESVILLYYQITSGVLYQNVGLLLMGFMAGMSVGALVVSQGAATPGTNRTLPPRLGYALLGGFVLVAGLVVGLLAFGPAPGLTMTLMMMIATGLVVGGIFAIVSRGDTAELQQRLVSPLYAADLLGGFLGALLGGLILVPFLGLTASGALILLVAITILLLSALYGTLRFV